MKYFNSINIFFITVLLLFNFTKETAALSTRIIATLSGLTVQLDEKSSDRA